MSRVHVIYAKGSGELFNRQAALGSYIHCLCTVLQKHGAEVLINGDSFEALNKNQQPGVHIVSLSGRALYRFIPGFIKRPLKFLSDLKRIRALRKKLLKNSSYDVILEFYSCASNVGQRLSGAHGKPLVLLYDCPVQDEYFFFNGHTFLIHYCIGKRETKSLLAARHTVVYSNAVKDYINHKTKRTLPVSIYQNVDYTRLDYEPVKELKDEVIIGFVGSFLKWHRVDLLVKVFVRFKKEGKNIRLLLLGNGLEFQSIQQMVRLSGMEDVIEMPGFADGETLRNYKRRMHIGVMPGSNWYGAPNKIFEYGAAGIAVVAPATPTIADLFIHDKELVLFEQDNEQALYEALTTYINNPLLVQTHGRVLQEKIKQKYNEEITWNFYRNILS